MGAKENRQGGSADSCPASSAGRQFLKGRTECGDTFSTSRMLRHVENVSPQTLRASYSHSIFGSTGIAKSDSNVRLFLPEFTSPLTRRIASRSFPSEEISATRRSQK